MVMETTAKRLILYTMISTLTLGIPASANDGDRIGRYTLHPYSADIHEEDLLSTIIETTFPTQVATVGSAIDYVLLRSGYRHVPTQAVGNALLLPLPQVHRSIGPMDTRTALRTLIGSSWNMIEDSKTRVIWFQYAGSSLDSDIANQEVSQESDPEKPILELIPLQDTAVAQDWRLDTSKSLRQNLEQWVFDVNWTLEWNSHHDYEIRHSAVYHGTLELAVEAVLEHYRNAPFALTATFFRGNSVLLIEPVSTNGR